MRRLFDRYSGFWRRWKLFYLFFNLLNYKHLRHYSVLFRRYGLKRPVWMPLSAKHFRKLPPLQLPQSADPAWERDGFLQLKAVFPEDYVDRINDEISRAIDSGLLNFNYTQKKIVFAYEKIPLLKEIIHHPEINKQLKALMGDAVLPFQSINFIYGSEQRAHSDSMHMSTYPQGGLIAIWLALDDVEEDNGPLFYYPGSHKLPYVSNEDMGASTGWFLSPNPNKMYEEYIRKQIEAQGLKKEIYRARKGDVLIWHANLIHGGMPHLDKSKTRRSMVVHYFKKDLICYHEISQRPAVVKEI